MARTDAEPQPPGVRPSGFVPPLLQFLLFILIVAVLYAPGLTGAYFGDDLMFYRPLAGSWLEPFRHANAETGWYRPLEAVILGVLQRRYGLDTLPIHALAVVLHATVALLVAGAARRFGLGAGAAFAAALVFVVSQAGASAVLGNDTLSQILATLFGLAAVLLLSLSIGRRHDSGAPGSARVPSRTPFAVAGAIALLGAMLAKEAGIAWAGLAVLVVIFADRDARPRATARIVPLALIVVVVASYLFLRHHADGRPPSVGTSRYDLDPGPGVFARLALMLGVTVLPVSTVAIASAWQRDAYALVVAGGVLALAIGGVVVTAWWRAGRRATGIALTAAAVVVLGPYALLGHVSELYAYSALPFAAILTGGALVMTWGRAGRAGRAVLAVATALIVLLNASAVREKASLAAANGRRAVELLQQVEPVVARLPRDGTLLLVTPRGLPPGYSMYRLEGFEPLRYAEGYLRRKTERADVHVRVVDAGAAAALRDAATAVTLDGARVIAWAPAQAP